MILSKIQELIQYLVTTYGATTVLVVALLVFLIIYGFKIYQVFTRDRTVNRAFAEMERAVQRSAAEAREYKIAFFKEKLGWTDAQIDAYMIKNLPPDGPSARRALEGEGGKP